MTISLSLSFAVVRFFLRRPFSSVWLNAEHFLPVLTPPFCAPSAPLFYSFRRSLPFCSSFPPDFFYAHFYFSVFFPRPRVVTSFVFPCIFPQSFFVAFVHKMFGRTIELFLLPFLFFRLEVLLPGTSLPFRHPFLSSSFLPPSPELIESFQAELRLRTFSPLPL